MAEQNNAFSQSEIPKEIKSQFQGLTKLEKDFKGLA